MTLSVSRMGGNVSSLRKKRNVFPVLQKLQGQIVKVKMSGCVKINTNAVCHKRKQNK